MRHLTPITGRKDYPATGHTAEEIAKFLTQTLGLLGDALGLAAAFQALQDSKNGTGS